MMEMITKWINGVLEWFRRLFGGVVDSKDGSNLEDWKTHLKAGREIPCPYCLQPVSSGSSSSQHCEHCENEISAIYIQVASSSSACPIEVFGWPGHGKTVYLYALTWILDRIAPAWAAYMYTCTPATEASRKRLKDVREAQRTGVMPEATPLGVDEVYLLLLEGLVRWNQRTVMIRDCSGEAFEGFRFDTQSLKYFERAPFTMMFVSLSDLAVDHASSMDMLLVSYRETLLRQQIPESKKNLIVVLSKGDEIEELPEKLQSYLMDDPLSALLGPIGSPAGNGSGRSFGEGALKAYLEGMQIANDEIEKWLLGSGWGTQFVQHARRHAFEVRYCIVSSIGSPVSKDQRLSTIWAPKRVLDPLFWALKLSESRY